MSNNEFTLSLQNESDALTGMTIIHAMSTACQGVIDVKKPTGKVSPVSLNALVVAESGARKTTVASMLFKGVLRAKNKEGV